MPEPITPAAPATDPAPSNESSTAVTTPDPATGAPAATPDPAPASGNIWDDPAAAKSEIEKLRRENAASRTNAKAQAAEAAKAELAQTIGKALGLVQDEPIDPAKLTESLTASQAEAKQARVELAVFKAAATAGGDPAALLDSSSFLASLAAVDPSDSAAVTAAIQAAVTANPRLGAAPAGPTPPAPNPAQGASATGAPTANQLTTADMARMTPAEIDKATREGRFNDLLSGKLS